MDRRKFLVAVSTVSTVGLAGCSEEAETTSPESDETESEPEAESEEGPQENEGGVTETDEDGQESEETAIRQVLQEQGEAMENSDLDAYMETIHPQSPLYNQTEASMAELLPMYEFQVDIEINSVNVHGDTATTDVTQETRIEGSDPNFEENRSVFTHELRTFRGDWYIFDSVTHDYEAL